MNNDLKKQMFLDWCMEHSLLYGPYIAEWFKEEGCEAFFKWANKKGIEYVKS